MFGTRIKIMWEEQHVDLPIQYLTCVIVPWSSVKSIYNNFVNESYLFTQISYKVKTYMTMAREPSIYNT